MKTFLLFIAFTFFVASALHAADRVALVIGNGAYSSAKLPNPVNDAPLVAASLQKVGFKVIQKTDLTRDGMRAAVREFSDALGKGDTALFYYAGHGAQVKDENYLIPVDAPLGMKEYEAEDRSVKVNLALAAMEECGSALNIVILDCCRDNPFARSWRSASNGLAEMKAPQETLIAYATAPGTAASDGEGSNSPYSQALAEEILRPGVKLQDVFFNVARRVHTTTNGEQRPWTASDLLSEFVFVRASPPAVSATVGAGTLISTPSTSVTPLSVAPPGPSAPVDIPACGYFDLATLFDGTSYDSFNEYSRTHILKTAQEKLKASGAYAGTPDGLPGPGTHHAVVTFQQAHGLQLSGKLDASTLSLLELTNIGETQPPVATRKPPQARSRIELDHMLSEQQMIEDQKVSEQSAAEAIGNKSKAQRAAREASEARNRIKSLQRQLRALE